MSRPGPWPCSSVLSLTFQENVPLAPRTTLELGGPARWFVEAQSDDDVMEALRFARDQGARTFVLGGGSNVVIADRGFDGLVLAMRQRGVEVIEDGDVATVRIAAGEPWDPVVETMVDRGLAGVECLSGIPGLCGALPIQNVGAYGQEIAECLVEARVLDRGVAMTLSRAECELAYRSSRFKREPGRFIVLGVTLRLEKNGAPAIRYAELQGKLTSTAAPVLADVRRAVLELRAAKSMVIHPLDENRRSVGSYFMNPVVSKEQSDRVVEIALAEGCVLTAAEVPRYAVSRERVKLAAGWLVEKSGVSKGLRQGAFGVSTKHALSLVHHGGGQATDLVELARHVRESVRRRFGIELAPEAVHIGVIL